MRVKWVRAYFNSSQAGREDEFAKGCRESKEKNKGVCEVTAWDKVTAAEGPEMFDRNAGTAGVKGGGKGKESRGSLSGSLKGLSEGRRMLGLGLGLGMLVVSLHC